MSEPTQCPNRGHSEHDGEFCLGRADEGANACACSWPDPFNYAELPELPRGGVLP